MVDSSNSSSVAGMLDTLDVALYAFCLIPPSANEGITAALYRDLMAARTSREGMRRSADREAIFAAQRLRLALQLAPVDAIDYSASNPTARWRIIELHLLERYPQAGREIIAQLAHRIATTLDDWREQRGSRSVHERDIWKKADGKCCSCHYDFNLKSSPALLARDKFKPYFDSPEELTSPEIDHIVAISGLGTDGAQNLQLLCRWCNFGKGDGLGVDIRKEAENAAIDLEEMRRSHVANMFYMTLADSGFECENCNGQTELTIRLRDDRHGFLLSNLLSICYACTGLLK